MPELSTEWITLTTEDGPMSAYVARPGATAHSCVVVLQEAFGVNEHIQDVSRRLAERGHLVIAPELFHRTGPRVVGYDDHPQAMALIGALGPDQIRADVDAVLNHLATAEGLGAKQTAIIGFCFGGRAAFTAATMARGLAAAVVFYGPGIAVGPYAVLERADQITAAMLMHVGADDPTIPADQVHDIDVAMHAAGSDFQQFVYPDAGHAFACDARPQMYKPVAARTAWQRTHDFLDHHLPAA